MTQPLPQRIEALRRSAKAPHLTADEREALLAHAVLLARRLNEVPVEETKRAEEQPVAQCHHHRVTATCHECKPAEQRRWVRCVDARKRKGELTEGRVYEVKGTDSDEGFIRVHGDDEVAWLYQSSRFTPCAAPPQEPVSEPHPLCTRCGAPDQILTAGSLRCFDVYGCNNRTHVRSQSPHLERAALGEAAAQLAEAGKRIEELERDLARAHKAILSEPPWLSDAAEALGEVRKSDGAPYVLNWTQALDGIRELRAENEEACAQLATLESRETQYRALVEAARSQVPLHPSKREAVTGYVAQIPYIHWLAIVEALEAIPTPESATRQATPASQRCTCGHTYQAHDGYDDCGFLSCPCSKFIHESTPQESEGRDG